MTEEMYKRLNNYLNNIFLELNEKDKIFVDNLRIITTFNIVINNYFNCCIEDIQKQNNLTFNDVFLLGREIIEKINPKYLIEYDNLIDSGYLDFKYENINDNSCCLYKKTNTETKKWIDISRKFNYRDVTVLIHEFFHYTQFGSEYTTYNHKFFTEFISIYFEKIAEKYLIEEKNISKDEISTNSRIIDFLHCNSNFYKYSVILLAYENLGNINENTINDLNNLIGFKDSFFEKECIIFLNKLDKINNLNNEKDSIIKMTNFVRYDYKYIIGTVLAYYALENCKLEDIIKLNDNINLKESAELSVVDILNDIGISTNSNMINETLKIIENSIYSQKREKTK